MKSYKLFGSLILIALCGVASIAQSKTPSITKIRDVDQPARQSFAKFTQSNFSTVVTVPEGKVLVVESVSANISSALGEVAPITVYVMNANDPPGDQIKQVLTFAPSHQTNNHKTFYTHQTRFYVPAGHSVYVFWFGEATPVSYLANFSGHFVDL